MTLRVTVEIVPFGDETKLYEIGRLDIFNKGQIDFDHCVYGTIFIEKEKDTAGLFQRVVSHRRDRGAWQLIRKVIEEYDL